VYSGQELKQIFCGKKYAALFPKTEAKKISEKYCVCSEATLIDTRQTRTISCKYEELTLTPVSNGERANVLEE
jgi:hypothetical protein